MESWILEGKKYVFVCGTGVWAARLSTSRGRPSAPGAPGFRKVEQPLRGSERRSPSGALRAFVGHSVFKETVFCPTNVLGGSQFVSP